MWGHLRSMSVHALRRRVSESLHHINPAAVRACQCTTVSRRPYSVPAPNSLWHTVQRQIVIHGGIDGFSQCIVYLNASTNNQSDNVLQLLVNVAGCPD